MRSTALAAASNWVAFAAALGVSFFLTPYLIRTLGTARYDVWCVAESVLAYVTLLDMGLAACLVRFAARLRAADDISGLNKLASSCLAVYAAAAVVGVIVGGPVIVAVAPAADAVPFLLVMLFNVAATLPLSVFPSLLDGLEKFAAKSLVRVLVLAGRTAAVLAVAEDGLVPIALAYTAGMVVEHVFLAALCLRYVPGLRLSTRCIDRATLTTVRGYSKDAFLAMLAGRVSLQTGAIVIGLMLPAGGVTAFAVAARLVEYAKTLLRQITATLTPGVSAMEARGDWAGIRALVLAATRWVLYVVLPVNVGLWLFGRAFLTRWVGPEVADAAFPAAAVLAFTLTIGVAQSVASRVLYGLGELKLFARYALVEAAWNLALTLHLIGPFGVTGVAVAVAVPNVVFCVWAIRHAGRVIGLPVREYLTAWAKPLVAATIPAGVWLVREGAEAAWPAIFGGLAAGLVPYAVVVLVLERPRRATAVSPRVPPALRRGPETLCSGSPPR